MDTTAFQVHHFWWGLILIVIAFVLTFIVKRKKQSGKKYKGLMWAMFLNYGVGFIIALDDVIQHVVQIWIPTYLSPLHNLYVATLYKIEWIQRLNQWADSLFR